MISKMIIAIVALLVIAILAYVITTPRNVPQEQVTPGPTEITEETVSSEVSSVLGEQYSSLIEEELNKLSIEQTDFNNYMQDSMANDLSQFYY